MKIENRKMMVSSQGVWKGRKQQMLDLLLFAVGTSSRGGLGKLSIRGSNTFRGVTNLGLSAVAQGCPSLKSLALWDISSVGDEGLIEIAKGCPLLAKLDLFQCPSISNKGLIAITENCPNLTSLNIESCSRIGNEGLQAIGRSCFKLQSISIRDCVLVGDYGVSSLLSSGSSVAPSVEEAVLEAGGGVGEGVLVVLLTPSASVAFALADRGLQKD